MTTEQKIQELEKQLEELKQEIAKQDKKQDKKEHKSLSDYRVYERLGEDTEYKIFDDCNEVMECIWNDSEFDEARLTIGNVYSYNTPNELLEREIKKRQLWFELEKHLKENNCLATNEDWKYRCADKYCVDYDLSDESFYIEVGTVIKCNNIYSTDEETLKDYMKTLSEENIKIMFDVE